MKRKYHGTGFIMVLLCFCRLFSFMLFPDLAAADMVKINITANPADYVGYNPSTNTIYAVSTGSKTVQVINGTTNTVSATIPITTSGTFDPFRIAVNPHNNKVYTIHSTDGGTTVIDGATNTSTFVATSTGAAAIAVNTITDKVYITNTGNNTLSVINGSTNAKDVADISVGGRPTAVAINATTNRVYVTNYNTNTVSVIDGSTNTVIATVTVGTNPYHIAVNETTNKIYVANWTSNNVSVIDGISSAVTTTVAASTNPSYITVNPVSNKVYVANANSAMFTVIDGATDTAINLPFKGKMAVVNTVTNMVYVPNDNNSTLSIITGATNAFTTLYPTYSTNDVAVNVSGNFVYLANGLGVTVIDSNSYALTAGTATPDSGSGTVTATPLNTGPYSSGAVVTLNAVPAAGSFFTGWSGTACNGNLSTTCMVTMDAAKSVTATFTVTAPPVTTWSNSLGNTGSDENATVVQQTADGGYVMAGSYGNNGGTTKDFWIVKLNADGSVAWQQRYNAHDSGFGIDGVEEVASIQQIADGGYIVAGVTQINGNNGHRGWILRLDATGNHNWNRAYGSSPEVSTDSLRSVIQSADGGFIATGGTGGSVWLIKLTNSGTTEWQKALGAGFGTRIIQSADGGYLVGGQAVVIKVASDGTVAWKLGFDTPGTTWISSIVQNSDGSCTVAGYLTIGSADGYDFWVARIAGDGTVIWQKSYGSAALDLGSSLYPTFDGGYVVAGYTSGAGAGMGDILLIRLNSNGDLQWAHTYGSPSIENGAGVQQTADGGFILVGQTYVGTGLYKNDAWIMKLDSNGLMSESASSAIGTPTLTVADPGILAAITFPAATTVTGKSAKNYAATPVVPTDIPVAVVFALPTYTVNFTVTPPNSGTLTGTASQTAITSGGSTSSVTAVSNSGYSFVNWTGTGGFTTTTTNPLTVSNVTANMTITANFVPLSAQVAAGDMHTVFIANDGALWAMGLNTSGQLGDGTTTQRSYPVRIGTDTNWTSLAAGYDYTLAIKADGTLWAWGNNTYGQLGDGTNVQKNTPVQIGTDITWRAVSAGNGHTLARKSDGTLWSWGYNNYGQLGDNPGVDRNVPAQVGTDTFWNAVSAGQLFSLATKTDGTLWAWGDNNNGNLGIGALYPVVPTKVGTDTTWSSISAGYAHTLATKSDGTLWAWGYNGWGQLGFGNFTQPNTPAQVGTDTNWLLPKTFMSHSGALKIDGSLWMFGHTSSGQIGNGPSINSQLTPIQTGTVTDWASFAVGNSHTAAVKSDGSLWTWGFNTSGQLGNGTTLSKDTPAQAILMLTTPRNNEASTSLTAPVSVILSTAMAAATINTTTFTLNDGTAAVSGTVSYNDATRTATFTPSANLTANMRYTATLSTGITNSLDIPLGAPFVWTFINDTLPPSNGVLTAIPGSKQIALSWTGFVDADVVASYKLVSLASSLPTDCGGNGLYSGSDLAYVDSGLPVNTTRYYGLCATDAAGNSTLVPVTASATTFTASTLLWETFDLGSLPADWSMVRNYGGDWKFYTAENPTGGSGGYAIVDVYSSSDLLTPALNLTGLNNPVLEFKSVYTGNLNDATLSVDVSTDGGSTWSTPPLLQTSTPYIATISLIPLATAIGQNRSNIIIRFNFQHNDGGSPSWAIDDVKVYDQSDYIAPVVTDFTAPATSSSRTIAITSFSSTDAVGVAGYLLKDTPVQPPASDPAWSSSAPTTYTCRLWGNNTLYAYTKDAAGNISTPVLKVILIGPTDGIIVPAPLKLEPTIVDAIKSLNFAMKVATPNSAEFTGANVSPLVNGIPQPPNGKTTINLGDTIVTLRRVIGL